MAQIVAGGYKNFGPTYNSTKWVRFGHEGTINSLHYLDPDLIPVGADTKNVDITDGYKRELAGKIAAYKAVVNDDGTVETYVTLADGTSEPAGLIVDDLGDALNASNKISFYFRGGEYYINTKRLGACSVSASGDDGVNDESTDGEVSEAGTTTDNTEAWVEAGADIVGLPLYADENGALTTEGAGTVVAVVTTPATVYTTGNMFENAGVETKGGYFVGIQLRI